MADEIVAKPTSWFERIDTPAGRDWACLILMVASIPLMAFGDWKDAAKTLFATAMGAYFRGMKSS